MLQINSKIIATKEILLRNVLAGAFGRFVPAILSFFVMPYLVLRLGVDRFGLYILASTVVSYVFFLDFGISKTYVKFISEFNAQGDDTKINSLINTSMVFYLFLSLILICAFILLEPRIYTVLRIPDILRAEARGAFFIAVGSLIISLPLSWTAPALMGFQRFDAMNIIQVIFALIINGVTLIIVFLGGGIVPLILVAVIGMLVINISSVIVLRKIFHKLHLRFHFDFHVFKMLFSMGWKMQVDGLSSFLVSSFNRIPIAMTVGPSGVAGFEIGMKISALAMSMVSSFPTAFVPAASESFASNQESRLGALFIKGSKYMVLTYLPLFVFAALVSPLLIKIWMGKDFETSATICTVLLVMGMIQYSTGIMAAIALGKGNVEIGMFTSIITTIIYFLTVFPLLSVFGTVGAAISLLIAMAIGEIYFWIVFHRKVLMGSMLYTVRQVFFSPLLAVFVSSILIILLKLVIEHFFNMQSASRIVLIIYMIVLGVIFSLVYLVINWRTRFIEPADYVPIRDRLLNYIKMLHLNYFPSKEGF